MKLIYQCMYCQINIFDATQDVCREPPIRKHAWRVQEFQEGKDNKTNYLKEVIYV